MEDGDESWGNDIDFGADISPASVPLRSPYPSPVNVGPAERDVKVTLAAAGDRVGKDPKALIQPVGHPQRLPEGCANILIVTQNALLDRPSTKALVQCCRGATWGIFRVQVAKIHL